MVEVDARFAGLKALHAEVFASAKGRRPESRRLLEERFFVQFVMLFSHPDFRSRKGINALIARIPEYRSERLDQADYASVAQQAFLYWHSGPVEGFQGRVTSFCARKGYVGEASSLDHLRGLYINYLRWRIVDAARAERAESALRRWFGIATEEVDSIPTDMGSWDADVPSDEEVLEDALGPLQHEICPGEVLEELKHHHGVKSFSGELVLSELDASQIDAAAAEFYDAIASEVDRKRLGVWAAYHMQRDSTFHDGGRRAATTSGYAKAAEALGLGRAASVGDTLNRKLGIARGYDGAKARTTLTMRDRLFSARGWAPSGDDRRAMRVWKLLIEAAFRTAVARVAIDRTRQDYGILPRVEEYKR